MFQAGVRYLILAEDGDNPPRYTPLGGKTPTLAYRKVYFFGCPSRPKSGAFRCKSRQNRRKLTKIDENWCYPSYPACHSGPKSALALAPEGVGVRRLPRNRVFGPKRVYWSDGIRSGLKMYGPSGRAKATTAAETPATGGAANVATAGQAGRTTLPLSALNRYEKQVSALFTLNFPRARDRDVRGRAAAGARPGLHFLSL